MVAKRKADNGVEIISPYKKLRSSEWLSDSEKDSSSSEPERDANHGSSRYESLSPEEDATPNSSQIAEKLNSGQFPGSPRLEKATSSSNRLLPQASSPGSNVPRKTDQNPPSFAELGVIASLVASLSSMSIRVPTPVQAACIPPLLDGNPLLLSLFRIQYT